MVSQVYEVFEDIVIPWQRELKEKHDLLREDPFVGFLALAIVGAVFYFFTRQSPSWIGFLLHYLGIAMFFLGTIAALAAGWFGWNLYRYAAWPTALLVLVIYGCFDTYQVSTTTERQRASAFRGEEGATLTITQTDVIKRFSGRLLHRNLESFDQIAGRTVRRSIAEGPLDSAGQKHGRWEESSLIPKRPTTIVKWYWRDREVSEADWQKKMKDRK